MSTMIVVPEYNMPTQAVASKFKVELANFGVEGANRPAWQHPCEVFNRLEGCSEPVRFTAIGKTSDGRSYHKTIRFCPIRQVERAVSHDQDVYLGKTF